MPKLDLDAIPQANTTGYPEPYNRDVAGRWHRRIAPATGMTRMGASHVVLKPGAWSSQRHWHAEEDELLVMLSGEAVLVEEDGETVLRAGDICVGAPGGELNLVALALSAPHARFMFRQSLYDVHARADP